MVLPSKRVHNLSDRTGILAVELAGKEATKKNAGSGRDSDSERNGDPGRA